MNTKGSEAAQHSAPGQERWVQGNEDPTSLTLGNQGSRKLSFLQVEAFGT